MRLLKEQSIYRAGDLLRKYDDLEGKIQSSIAHSMQEVSRIIDKAPKEYKQDLENYALKIFKMAADGDW
jgi:N-acetylglucosamine kinase-like BadF-type ATPase